MHVVVLGAGVVGVTTAYYLAKQGCDVTVIDRAADVAAGASHANGGQLSYSFTDSLARPGFISQIPGLLLGRDPTSKMSLTPALVRWGLRFLSQCTVSRSDANTVALLNTALQSAQLMTRLREEVPLQFSFRPAGKLVLLSNDKEIATARRVTAVKQQHGCDVNVISTDEALDIEPALQHFSRPITAAVYSASDEVADAHAFVMGMRRYLEANHAVQFRLSTDAKSLVKQGNKVVGVDCGDTVPADAVIVCLGTWSGPWLKTGGLNTQIYPVRGYSLTLPAGPAAPSVSITSLSDKFVYSRLNGHIRIAGYADFKGYDASNDADRTRALHAAAMRVAPKAADYTIREHQPWGGFRPMTPSGQPIVGRTPTKGLYANTGHGMLGWTLACATAQYAANAATGVSE